MKFKRVVLLGLLAVLNSCYWDPYYRTPFIGFSYIGDDYIDKIELNWNGYIAYKTDVERTPGNTNYFNFAIKTPSDMFGPVHIQFQNAKGEIIKKDFIFKNENLPKDYSIEMFFSQNDVEVFVGRRDIKEIHERNKKLYPLTMEYRVACLNKPIKYLYELNGEPPVKQCRPNMPIHKSENAAKLKQYHKLQAEYDAQKLKKYEEYQKRKTLSLHP